jgi:23S rRNA (adenine2503-C2)-methyltransferase
MDSALVKPFLLGLAFDEFAALGRRTFLEARGEAKGSGIAGELYGRFFRTGVTSPEASGLTAASQALWDQACSTASPLTLDGVHRDEGGDGPAARKAVFQLDDGPKIETVWIPMDAASGGRGTLCLSSQAGCAMACAFCETGRTGLLRNLTAAEIVAQVHAARFELGWDFSSLVFMGMGEPLHNLDQVIPALKVLMDPRGFAFAQDKITVCTVGLVDGIERLAALGWKRLGLSLSLNAGAQPLRERLMPAGVTNALPDLGRTLAAYPQRRNFVLALNYCLLPGINDSAGDALGVAEFAAGLGRTVVNVIPYNPGSVPLTTAPAPDEVDAFLELLRAQGLDARLRGTKGRSIMAACGQLGGRG